MLKILRNFFGFKGRISRGKFWLYQGFLFLAGGIFVGEIKEFGFFEFFFLLILLWIGRSIFVRRLHDLGRSGTIFKNPLKEERDFIDAYFKKGEPFKNQYDID